MFSDTDKNPFFESSPEDIFIDFRAKGRERQTEIEIDRETETETQRETEAGNFTCLLCMCPD